MLRVVVALMVLSFPVLAIFMAGTASSSVHKHPVPQVSPAIIDGALNPELIPDSLAYRLYFAALSVPAKPTEADRTRQLAQLALTGLSENDQKIVLTVLADFQMNHEAAIAQYNQRAESVSGFNQPTEIAGLLHNLDDLVQSTRNTLTVRLTQQGMTQLHAIVMAEKKNMQMQSEDK